MTRAATLVALVYAAILLVVAYLTTAVLPNVEAAVVTGAFGMGLMSSYPRTYRSMRRLTR